MHLFNLSSHFPCPNQDTFTSFKPPSNPQSKSKKQPIQITRGHLNGREKDIGATEF